MTPTVNTSTLYIFAKTEEVKRVRLYWSVPFLNPSSILLFKFLDVYQKHSLLRLKSKDE